MAPPPSQETITVAIAALRDDSRRWRDGAVELAAAKDAASRLWLGQFEFSTPASWTGLTEVYQELQQRLTRLLEDGSVALDSLGTTLLGAADAYEDEDRAGAHQIRGTW